MKPLQLTMRKAPVAPVDMSHVTPDRLAGMKNTQISSIKVTYGKKSSRLDELFSLSGADTNNIIICGGSNQLLYLGHSMTQGSITVEGNTGDYAGSHMQGGTLTIHGNAGSWTGCAMAGGRIEVYGDTGDFTGAGLPRDTHGMSNGLIFISGKSGDRTGDRMRRGIIIVCGNAGAYCGSRMQAGTVLALGRVGEFPGYGMRRGTLVLARKPAHIGGTFTSCGVLKMQFLRLLFKQLSIFGKAYAFLGNYLPTVHRYAGDLASNGKGEILVLLEKVRKQKTR